MKKFTFLLGMFFIALMSFAQEKGSFDDSKVIKSKILNMDRKYSIYLPPGYESSNRSYPILYLLHPAGPANTIPNHKSWVSYGALDQYLNAAIAKGEIVPMIVVTPDANFENKRISYFNDPENDFNFEDFFFQEFIPQIEKIYRVKTDRNNRAIAGASLGGAATLQYAIRHKSLFTTVCALSAAVRDYETDYMTKRYPGIPENKLVEWYKPYNVKSYIDNLPSKEELGQKWYIACGDDDKLSVNNCNLHISLANKGIAHEFRIQNGAHDWKYWISVTPDFLNFVSEGFKK
nr:alpha/beta hydrolase-fold protein [uncultured Pedobacter sp.]